MKKKYVILIIVGLVLAIGGFFGYKSYYYFKYIPDALEIRNNYINGLVIDETITVKTKQINSNDYFTVNDINIRNDFKNFELSDLFINDSNGSGYVLKENGIDKEPKTVITLGKSLFNIVEIEKNIINANDKWMQDLLKKKNIKNDLDLLLYTINNKNKKPNILSSKKEIEFYTYEYITLNLYPVPEKITLIDGDLTGFIVEAKDKPVREIYLFDGVNKYVISLWNKEYFTYDYIEDLLNTIVIGEVKENNITNNETTGIDISTEKSCTYTETYTFFDYYENKDLFFSDVTFNIILEKFQSKTGPIIVTLNSSNFNKDFIKGQNYEITYKTTVDYSRGFLDERTEIIKINPTDKEGLNQTQETCILK